MSNAIKEYLESNGQDFGIFDMRYTEENKKSIKDFNINKTKSFDICGKMEDMKEVFIFISDIGNNSQESIQYIGKLIISIISSVMAAFGEENAWVSLRFSTPNDLYKLPRWHKDGHYTGNFGNTYMFPLPKFITTPKGPSTLLIRNTVETNAIYNKVQNAKREELKINNIKVQDQHILSEKYRKIYAEAFKHCDIIQPRNDEGTIIYPTHESQDCKDTIHSEPHVTEQRFFLSILPSSEYIINYLKSRMQKPQRQ
jgi:hypothetical protein